MDQSRDRSPGGVVLGAAFVLGAAALCWAAMRYAPTERTMGDVQRIFYMHVPAAMNGALAFVVAAIAGAGYLIRRGEAWDRVGRTAVELGTLWATVVLVTGPIWARSAWGAWWTWEPRLTTTLIAWLIYVGAILVRRIAHDPEQAARLASVIAIIGVLDLPIVYKSVDWWRGNHPIVFGKGGGGLAPEMRTAFLVGALAVTLVHAVLFCLRYRLARLEDRVAAAERLADEREGLR
ncbi:MAG: cytochrome C assembly protein [Acidobacteria bacterium]|nr:MAG: cytochrome C assembly protein [Acidobacteriota bacterium]